MAATSVRLAAPEVKRYLDAVEAHSAKWMPDAYRASVEGDFVCNYAHHAAWEKDILLWPHPLTPTE